MTQLQAQLPQEATAREELLRLSLDAAPVGIAMLDTDLRFIASSRAFRESLGIPNRHVVGLTYAEVFPTAAPPWLAAQARCLLGATEHAEADDEARPDGRPGYWQWEMRPWHSTDGSIGGLVMFVRNVTASVQQQHTVRQLADALDNASAGICIVEPAGNTMIYANPAFARLHGLPIEQLRGRVVLEMYPPGARAQAARIIALAEETGSAVFESPRIRGDSGSFPALVAMTAVRDALGVLAYRINTVLDISAQAQAAAAARAQDARFRDYIAQAPISVCVLDAQGHVEVCNPAGEAMLGAAPGSLIGHNLFEVHAPGHRLAVQAEFDRLRQTGRLLREYRMRRADGSPFWAMFSASMLENGSVLMFIQDIDTLRATQDALHAAEDDLHAVVQLGPGVQYRCRISQSRVQLLNVHGDLARLTASRKAEHEDGAEVAEVLALPASLALLRRLVDDPDSGPASADIPMAQDGGAPRWVRNTARAVRRADGLVDVIGYLTDVTLEIEEQQRLQRVATLVTLGGMATGMAHELNQPLASISFAAQNAELMLQNPGVELAQIGKKMAKIDAEARRASQLLDHLKLFARNDQQPQTPVTWQQALAGAMELLGPRLRSHPVDATLPDTLPAVLGTPILMEQVLVNLLSNAMDAYDSPHRPATPLAGRIVVEGDVAGETVILRVIDHAGGIPPDILGRIFEPFFTTKSPGKGTGLGLAVSLGTVSRMGGTLTAYNRADGAVFEIRTPAAAVAAAA